MASWYVDQYGSLQAEESRHLISLYAAGAGTMKEGQQRQFLAQLDAAMRQEGSSSTGYAEIPLETKKANLAAMGLEVN